MSSVCGFRLFQLQYNLLFPNLPFPKHYASSILDVRNTIKHYSIMCILVMEIFTHYLAGKVTKASESAILLTPASSDSIASPILPPPIKVVPPGVKTVNVTKGFEVLSVKQDHGWYCLYLFGSKPHHHYKVISLEYPFLRFWRGVAPICFNTSYSVTLLRTCHPIWKKHS